MRTTLHLNDALFKEAKRLALETHKTFTAVIEDALRQLLANRREATATRRTELPTFAGKGLQPGVDLDHTSSLLDLMERRE